MLTGDRLEADDLAQEALLRMSRSDVLATLPRSAEELLAAREATREVFPRTSGHPLVLWCSGTTTDEARTFARILEDAGIQVSVFGDQLRYGIPGEGVSLMIGPSLPHEA